MYGDRVQCLDHFSSVVLIEAVVRNPEPDFSLDQFTQPNPAYPHAEPQVPWDEGLLTSNGESLLARRINCVTGVGPLRFAFYLQYWDPNLPLRWKHGDIKVPQLAPMPLRLRLLMPYTPCG
jgi:hypothetical protein